MTEQTPQQTGQEAPPMPEASPAQTVSADADEKLFAAVGYVGPLFVLSLVAKPKSAYCKFHAKQSMVLFLLFFIFLILMGISSLLGSLFFLPYFALWVVAVYKAYIGELWKIPVISEFAGKIDVESLYGKAGLAVSGISGLKDKAAGVAQKAGEAAQKLGKQEEEKK